MLQKGNLEKLLKEKKISQRTFDKVIIGKQIIERKYNLRGTKYSEWNNIIEKINSLEVSNEQKDKINKKYIIRKLQNIEKRGKSNQFVTMNLYL